MSDRRDHVRSLVALSALQMLPLSLLVTNPSVAVGAVGAVVAVVRGLVSRHE